MVVQTKSGVSVPNSLLKIDPEIKEKADALDAECSQDETSEEEQRKYHDKIIEKAHGINLFQFLEFNDQDLTKLYIKLDVSPESCDGKILAGHLGLTTEEIGWIMKYGMHYGNKSPYDNLGDKSPTKKMMQVLRTKDKDMTLGMLLETLQEMKRPDLFRIISQLDMTSTDTNATTVKEGKAYDEFLQNPVNVKSTTDLLSDSSPLHNRKKKKKKPKGPCIMLLFAEDGREEAEMVSEYLLDRGIGVIMLEKMLSHLLSDPNNTLHKWFLQVDFIVPVLTPLYLQQIQNCVDVHDAISLYNREVYRLTLDQYASKGSRNLRCRSVCPAKFFKEIHQHPVVQANGLFQGFRGCSSEKEIESFAMLLKESSKSFKQQYK